MRLEAEGKPVDGEQNFLLFSICKHLVACKVFSWMRVEKWQGGA